MRSLIVSKVYHMMQRLSGSLRFIAYSLYTLAGLIALAWLLFALGLASWLPDGLYEPAGAAAGVLAGLVGWLADRSARGQREGTPSQAPAAQGRRRLCLHSPHVLEWFAAQYQPGQKQGDG